MKKDEIKRGMKGAITVFMVIVYIWVFILMGVLVDGVRVRLAEAEAEQIQQIANETAMTYYNRALYEYYDLFGETGLSQEAIGSMMQEIMQQSMSLELSGDLQKVMDSKFIFSLDEKDYFDPYDLKVESIETGSNLNLLDKDIFVSQVEDAMKYNAPLILANNLANLVDSFGAASEGIKAVDDCNDALTGISGEIEDYMEDLEQFRYRLNNFCEEPWKSLSTKKKNSAEADDSLEYVRGFDDDASRVINRIVNQILEISNDEELDLSQMDEQLDEAYGDYQDKMNKVLSNGQSLYGMTQDLIEQGKQIQNHIVASRRELENKSAAQSNVELRQVYLDFSDALVESEQAVQKYIDVLKNLSIYLNVVQRGGLISWTSYWDACKGVLNTLKETHNADAAKMAEDETVKQFCETLSTQLKNILDESGRLARIENNDSKLKDAEKQVAQANGNLSTDAKDKIDDTDRLGRVTTIRETAEEEGDTSFGDKYDRDNAKETADELGSLTTGLVDMIANAGEALMENLYSDAYILTNFRDYVHTYKMLNQDGTNNSGKDGYDTVANIKFLEGEKGLLTQKQFQQIETTCAEIEYVIYGLKDTKASVAAAYASIYGYRLALDYASVFLTPTYRNFVMESAAGTGPFAPAIIALLPLAIALPQAALDMTIIMQGKCTPLIYTNENDWGKTDFSNSRQYLAGYSDYLLIQLLMMDGEKKIERMQDIVQMNMRKIDSSFSLKNALVNVYARSTCSIKYLFMTQAFMPAGTRRDGRYRFEIHTNVSY